MYAIFKMVEIIKYIWIIIIETLELITVQEIIITCLILVDQIYQLILMGEIQVDKLVSIIYLKNSLYLNIDPQQMMNIINSVTSGMNFNFNNGFFNGGFSNVNNINIDGNYENDDDIEDDDYEENEEENEQEQFMKKREQFILELNEFQYKHLKKYSAVKEDKCAICLQKYKGIDIIKEFPCNHIFHKNCIFKWLKKSNVCPLCKHDITNDVNNADFKSEDDE